LTDLGNGLGLAGFLLGVLRDTLSLETFSFGVIFVITSEEIDFIVVIRSSRGRSSRTTQECLTSGAGAGERGKLGTIRFDVGVPPRDMGTARRR
jgi:hypothetical protein